MTTTTDAFSLKPLRIIFQMFLESLWRLWKSDGPHHPSIHKACNVFIRIFSKEKLSLLRPLEMQEKILLWLAFRNLLLYLLLLWEGVCDIKKRQLGLGLGLGEQKGIDSFFLTVSFFWQRRSNCRDFFPRVGQILHQEKSHRIRDKSGFSFGDFFLHKR